ncbi:MAG: hypothetical protein K6T91_10355 [Firmicutes bacterium]|nr:hypothetical protein [Bacillota bacterium]
MGGIATNTGSEVLVFGLTLKQFLAIIIPIVVIQISAIVAALINLRKQDNTAIHGGKKLWVIILIICLFQYPFGLLGPILYFTVARKPYESE